ncbi:unnamed protein product [Chondrus crispus]|uniref:ABC1 atypical kinase-like domain-containing protein n=1 Tax=Chondrus crispus TaxID=2769 RepID=R7QG25_CHOCR|nr:unnamed protein product [Chondrus crispus]CDF36728.1 unnamed protein product [Chondrus crispus]|eukprot:XP_005716547.1 unnamed protein product [Chondrus crispus]
MPLPSAVRYLPRRLHIFSTALLVYFTLQLTSLLNRLLRRDAAAVDAAWSASNTCAARLILRTASARRGLWIKCCQYVAARPDALPPEYSQVLSQSLDDCPPTPAARVIATVNEQLRHTECGRQWQETEGRPAVANDFFHEFDPAKPIASASIAQVHAAVLRSSGQRVVLKVQHPGVKPMLLRDLIDLKTLLKWIAGAQPRFDMRPVLDAWINMVPKETDFLNEMRNLQAVRSTLRGVQGLPEHLCADAYVPEPLPHLTSDKLFVMEYIDGCKVTDVDTMSRHDVNLERIILEITRSFGNQLFVSNVFSGDPHPGNFLVHHLSDGAQPVLLDFGICVQVPEKTRLGFAKLILAAIDSDSYSLIQALADVGVKLNRADPVASLDIIKYLFRTTAPREQARQEQAEFRKDLEAREGDIRKNERDTDVHQAFEGDLPAQSKKSSKREKTRSPIDSFPGDLVFLFRSLGMLRGLAVTLGVRHSYLETLRPFATYALDAACPPEQRLKAPVYRPIHTNGRRAARAASVLERVFGKLLEKNMMIGVQVAVYKEGKLVLNLASGRRGRYDPRPVKPDSVFNSFSSTKGLSAILFASLQDEYNIGYDDPVSSHWPEYAANGKGDTTVGHVLSHSAGLPYALPETLPMTRLRDDWEGIIKHLEESAPSFEPGSRTEYHALTFGWLVAGLITKATGMTYQQHLRILTEKLGIEDECFCGTMPEDLLPDVPGSRVASMSSSIFQDLQDGPIGKLIKQANAKRPTGSHHSDHSSDAKNESSDMAGDVKEKTERVLKDLNLPGAGIAKAPAYILDLNFFNHPVMRGGFVPSANGHFSARALAKLYGAVANDGCVDGCRILAPGRAEKMQERFCDIDSRSTRGWGAGLTLYDSIDKRGKEVKQSAIGHGGIGGSFAFAVPSENFAMAVTLNKLNAVSISAAVAISVVCKAFEVPTPSWYHAFAEKAMTAFKEGSKEKNGDEASLMEKILGGEGETDMMKILVG